MFFLLKLLKLGEIDSVKFLAWKSGGVKFWTNSMSGQPQLLPFLAKNVPWGVKNGSTFVWPFSSKGRFNLWVKYSKPKKQIKKIFFIEPESDHWLCLSVTDSLTDSLTNSCLVDLIDVTLACEDNNSILLRLLVLLMLMMRNLLKTVWCRFGRWNLVLKLSFCLDFEHKVSRFGQDFEVQSWSRLWS